MHISTRAVPKFDNSMQIVGRNGEQCSEAEQVNRIFDDDRHQKLRDDDGCVDMLAQVPEQVLADCIAEKEKKATQQAEVQTMISRAACAFLPMPRKKNHHHRQQAYQQAQQPTGTSATPKVLIVKQAVGRSGKRCVGAGKVKGMFDGDGHGNLRDKP